MKEERKLKRGLKDISKRFEEPQCAPRPLAEKSDSLIYTLSVFSPEEPEGSLLLNSFFAAHSSSPDLPASVISMQSSEGKLPEDSFRPAADPAYPVSHLEIDWPVFSSMCRRPLRRCHDSSPVRHLIYLNMDYRRPDQFTKVLPMLDKWVFFVKPEVDSLMAAYRYMKGARQYSPDLQHYLVFDGRMEEPLNGRLFEKFSEMVSSRLGIHLVWLGCLQSFQSARIQEGSVLDLETLFVGQDHPRSLPAALAMSQYIKAHSRAAEGVAV